MVHFQALGVKDSFKDYMKFFTLALDKPRLTFKGYNGTYYYKNLGHAEFSAAVVENKDGEKTLMGLGTHIMGHHNYRMRIEEVLENDEMSALCVCTPLEGDIVNIPVSFVLSDVLPSILPGDTVVFQGVAALSTGKFFFSEEEAENELGWKGQRYMGGELHLAPRLILYKMDPSLDKEYTYIYTKVKKIEKHLCLSQINREDFVPLYTLEAESPFGDITIAVAEEDLPGQVIIRLISNAEVYLYGIINFSGDVGIGEYQEGAVFDEEHLLRVLREALETGDFERLWKNMTEDCSYYGYAGRRLNGRDAITAKLKEVWDAQHENEKDIQHHAIGRITEVISPEKAKYGIGKHSLLSYCDPNDGVICLDFIEVTDGKISKVEFIYDPVYKFEVIPPEENPIEAKYRELKPVRTDRTEEEWQKLILSWLGKEDTDSAEFYSGLVPESTAQVLGEEICGKENVYVGIKALKNGSIPLSTLKISVRTNKEGQMERLEITQE